MEGVRKIGVGEGEKFNVAGAYLVWKVKADDSAYSFSVNELTLAPVEVCRFIATRQRSAFMYSPVRSTSFA